MILSLAFLVSLQVLATFGYGKTRKSMFSITLILSEVILHGVVSLNHKHIRTDRPGIKLNVLSRHKTINEKIFFIAYLAQLMTYTS